MRDPEQDVRGPAGPVPARRLRSIRRSTTIDITFPDGPGTELQPVGMRLTGRARDAVTVDPSHPPRVVAEARVDATLADRRIVSIDGAPGGERLAALIGERGGGHLRGVIDERLPGERDAGTPLYLLLDDISGISLIANVAWTRWPDRPGAFRAPSQRDMEGVCIGFAPGSSALLEVAEQLVASREDERAEREPGRRMQAVGGLARDDDPDGWHEAPPLPPVSTRRARFIDVTEVDGELQIEAGFQDSAGDPSGGRMAIHEYRLSATAELGDGGASAVLTSIEPRAHVLPFRECPSAVATAQSVVGVALGDLRRIVLERMGRTGGCTHLNDALRALADVPGLFGSLGAATIAHA